MNVLSSKIESTTWIYITIEVLSFKHYFWKKLLSRYLTGLSVCMQCLYYYIMCSYYIIRLESGANNIGMRSSTRKTIGEFKLLKNHHEKLKSHLPRELMPASVLWQCVSENSKRLKNKSQYCNSKNFSFGLLSSSFWKGNVISSWLPWLTWMMILCHQVWLDLLGAKFI